MVYYKKSEHIFVRFEKSRRKGKMYDAILKPQRGVKYIRVPFGDTKYQNFRDITGLNLYPHLIHGNPDRRAKYRYRHIKHIKNDYFSPSYFSYYFLW